MPVRAETGDALGFLGVDVEDACNRAVADDDAVVSATGAPVDTVVVHSREDLEMVREVRRVLRDKR